jgi:hypothetical protein
MDFQMASLTPIVSVGVSRCFGPERGIKAFKCWEVHVDPDGAGTFLKEIF